MTASTLTGAAGEHYVMSQLLRRGFIAALAPVGVPIADIIVTDARGEQVCAIQVKTRRELGRDGGWHMKAKHENIQTDNLFYIFVSFPADELKLPDTFVVPSRVVADVLRRSHRGWLNLPGRKGEPHKDGDMRRFLPDHTRHGLSECHGPGWLDKYRDAWDKLLAERRNDEAP